ncbi:hypothetical protein F2Q70_00030930 [Brassica cretica]|uniref:Uncharacterized protein n=1 Tax=Brassica cretica TaxID=69181 RepID=A0A3N6QTK9_BRACR|nr:hypothetical protein F2Q70_00030930 [Brassica cretica]KAF3597427.1 hypothetical protein DY000_02023613 [Brassica cretica]
MNSRKAGARVDEGGEETTTEDGGEEETVRGSEETRMEMVVERKWWQRCVRRIKKNRY